MTVRLRYPTSLFLFFMLLTGACHRAHRHDAAAETPVAQTAPTTPQPAAPAVVVSAPATTPERFLDHIEVLAHDAFQGRDTGEPGCDLAAGYIAGQFAALGVAPGGPDGSYFQPFTAKGRPEVQPETFLNVEPLGVSARVGTDVQPLGGSAKVSFEGEVVFAGYGIVNEKYNHDDYAGVDVTDKVVLVFAGEPDHLNVDGEMSEHARWTKKSFLAEEKGAAGMLVVNTNPGEGVADRLPRVRRSRESASIAKLHISRDLAGRMLAAAGLTGLDELEKDLATPGTKRSALLAGVTVRGKVAVGPQQLPTQNVVAMLPGNGAHADEYVVIGAHYDHVGVSRGRVYNGADDNASGVSGLIELAASLAREPRRERSVLFIAFSGEEINLLGSKHFVEHPTIPLKQVKAMLNMDMIGRLANSEQANPLQVFGVGTGESFERFVDRHAAQLNLTIAKERSSKVPTDSESFYDAGVPALWFFTGLHRDYHQPGDDIEKVDAAGGARIVQFIHNIALDIVNDGAAPRFVRVDEEINVHARASRQTQRVSMGFMPDFDDESPAPGLAVGDVRKTGPAGKAGLRRGDRIVSVNDQAIVDPTDYMDALEGKKPGDVVQVAVQRGGQTLNFSVELIAR